MRILNVVYNLNKGGTQRAAQNFCEGYHKNNVDSRMWGYLKGGIRKKELENIGIKCWIGKEARTEIMEWNPDVIHYHSHGLSEEDLHNIRSNFADCKFVETNVFSRPTKLSNKIKGSYQLSNWCKFLYELRGGKNENSPIIPYPVKTVNFYKESKAEIKDFKNEYDIPQDQFLFGRIGQNFMGKWSNYLIELFEKFVREVDQNAHLLVVNAPKEVLSHISSKSAYIQRRITVIDKLIGDDKLRKCYSAIDLFLLIVNQGESFGLVSTESLLCQTPIITLKTPWGDNAQPEVVGRGGEACCSIDDFYENMVKYYQNENLLKDKGRKGREHVIESYDYKKVAHKSIGFIKEAGVKKVNSIDPKIVLKDACNSRSILWLRKMAEKLPGGYMLNKIIRKKMNFELKL
jgi:glycosyltransferase involved in cell wall biosynthesis